MANKAGAKTRIHPETGATLRRGERDMTIAFKGMKRIVRVKGWFPEGSDDGIFERGDAASTAAALAEMKAEHAARVRALARDVVKKVASIRPAKKVTNTYLSELLTGSPNSFSKYALGNATPSHPTVVLLTLLDKRPELVREIEAAAAPATA
ncbi:MAG: type II toxin-antitoxin system MqsA family antitoxin [Alphaproteobacteria bacterium]|nr:type II toxin-antitoxin system MqsA family antitoxin [Alphaproteobacteria bacterium]